MASNFEYGARVRRPGLRAMAVVLLASTAILGSPAILPPAQAQVAATVNYAIPAGSLGSAISRFGDSSNLQLLYPAGLVRGRTTPGVSGRMTPAEALSRLLAGTGLDYSFTDARTVTITGRGAAASGSTPAASGSLVLDTIDVTGGGQNGVYAPYETAAPTTYVSGETIERFRGSSPADMFRGTPGVMSGESRNGAGSIDVNIRGMQGMGRVNTTIDGAENAMTVYQGYQGLSNRTYVDPDFIAGIDIQKGADAGSWGNAGSVAMRTLNADDIIKTGETWGIRVKGGIGGNTTSPVAGNKAGYLFNNPLGWSDPTTGYGSATPSATGMDRPSFLSPTNGSGSVVAAYRGDGFDVLAGYAARKQGNYFAGTHGPSADPVSTGPRPFCYSTGVCPPEYIYRDVVENAGLANYRAGEEVLNTELETESWLAKLNADLGEDQTLQLGYTGFRSEAGDRLASGLATDMSQAVQQAQTTNTSLDTLTARYRWNPADNDIVDLRANAYWSHLEQRNAPRLGVTKPESIGLPAGYQAGSDTDMWGGEIVNLSKFSTGYGNLDMTYGLSYRGEDTSPSKHSAALQAGLDGRDGIRHEVAGYAKASYKPLAWDWVTLNAGLRYSHFWSKDNFDPYVRETINNGTRAPGKDYSEGGFSPSVGVTVEPFDGTQLYVNYANAMRAPSIIETVSAFTLNSQDNVKPERSSNWEIGANFNREAFLAPNDRAMVKLGYFNWDVKDYIARGLITDPENPNSLSLVINNIDRAKFSGLEFSGRYELGGFVADLAANYFLNVEYCRTATICDERSLYGDYATNHVQPQYSVDLTLSQKLLEDRLTIGGRVSYVGPRAIGHGDVTAAGAQQFIAPVLWDPYALVDVFTEYKISENLTASFRVENLFDQYYIDPLGLVAQPGPGRTFYASLTGTIGGDQSLPSLPSPFGRGGLSAIGAVDWTGLYAGVHAGGGFARERGTTTAGDGTADATSATESADLSMNSGVFGVQAGYNWQFDNRVIVGVEGDWGKTWMKGSQRAVSTEGVLATLDATQAQTYYDIDWTASLRARLGYAAGERWMLYGTAGLALAQETQTREQYKSENGNSWQLGTSTGVASVEQASKTRLGYTVGSGIEYAINDRWTISGNYGYSHFGKRSFSFDTARSGVGPAYTESVQIGTEISPPLLAPDHALCLRNPPHIRCSAIEVPVYETTEHDSTYDVENGRKALNSLDIHTISFGVNYRF